MVILWEMTIVVGIVSLTFGIVVDEAMIPSFLFQRMERPKQLPLDLVQYPRRVVQF